MKTIFLSALLIIVIGSSAQNVSGKLNFQTGQKLEVTTNMNMSTQSLMGESSGNVIHVDNYTVANASDSETTLQKVPQRIKISFSFMDRDYNLDSDNKQDMEGQFGEPIKQILQQKHEFTVDAAGRITNVKGEKSKSSNNEAGMLGMMIPGMNASAAIPKVGASSIFKFLPEGREIAKGESWTDSDSTDDNRSTTTFIVKDITDNEVLLDYTQDGSIKTKQSAMGMSVDVKSISKSTGTVTLDRKTGIMRQKTTTTSTESNMELGGREINSTMKTTAVTTVKIL